MTELIWEGKYDKYACKVAPLHPATFPDGGKYDESAQERQRMLDLFGSNRLPE